MTRLFKHPRNILERIADDCSLIFPVRQQGGQGAHGGLVIQGVVSDLEGNVGPGPFLSGAAGPPECLPMVGVLKPDWKVEWNQPR